MDRLLDSLLLSAKHLSLLDKVFQENYMPYAQITQRLSNLPLYDELRKEVYVGGKKRGRNGYGRQMILGDLLQYIFTGRGYYFAVRGNGEREAFVRMIMYVVNQLLLMEDISVDVTLRNKVLDALQGGLGAPFYEDKEQKMTFASLRHYKGSVLPNEGKEHDDALDSLLPKRVGAVPELLVFVYLIRKNYGYVVPLLHAQRLLGNQGYIVPPDFLLLRSKSETFGIEVGRGKENQMGSFATVTSIPVFTAGIGLLEQPQPYRCAKCQRWITYCEEVIDLCAKNQDEGYEFACAQCTRYKNTNECDQVVYHGRASTDAWQLRYHYKCVKEDTEVQMVLSRARTAKLICPIPAVSGLEYLTQESRL